MEEVEKAVQLTGSHNSWRSTCINLIASENVMSPLAWRLYNCDFEHRYAEGMPGKRFYQGLEYLDEVELLAIDMAKRLFRAEYADLRPVSGSLAILAILSAFAKPGDPYVAPSVPAGAHISQAEFGAAGIRGLETHHLVLDEKEMTLDAEKCKKVIRDARPKLINAGGTVLLFPHPLEELREAADEVGSILTYDASHVLGLIAGGEFQDPLREGAEVVGASHHKTFPGPQGALIFGSNPDHYRKIKSKIFPGLVSNHHLHRLPALVVTLAEMLEFGREYAAQGVKNSRALAQALYERGFDVLCEHKGFTSSHQVIVDVAGVGGGTWVAETLEKADIILNKNLLPWDDVSRSREPSGIRIGIQEMTRFGMKEKEMETIAELIERAVIKKEDPAAVGADVREFRQDYSRIKYCYDATNFKYEFNVI
ncbi:MAG: serine hydroxymethyltransferase [Euryarchaeota archaeon]|nr:serine hydroxymethyltransferase [Euryarchaeota archaeon]